MSFIRRYLMGWLVVSKLMNLKMLPVQLSDNKSRSEALQKPDKKAHTSHTNVV